MTKCHWAAPFLPAEITSVRSLRGLQHQSDWLCLTDGSQWVAKLFNEQTWLGLLEYDTILCSEKLAAQVSERFAAYRPPFYVQNKIAVVKPYYPGKMLSAVTIEQAQIIGTALAQIHMLKIQDVVAKPFPAIAYPSQKDVPSWLLEEIESCNYVRKHREQEFIVSHRDLHLQNIIWPQPTSIHILDWESAGLIHPFIELIGVALNCAGMARGQFKPSYFKAVLIAYARETQLPISDANLWQGTLHSWLLWYSYCCKRQWQQEQKTLLQVISAIKQHFPIMQTLYNTAA